MFNSIFGYPGPGQNSTMNSGAALQNAYNQNQMASSQHSANMAAQQQALQGLLMQSQMAQQQHRFMIDGRTMTFNQWLDELAPGEDNSLRTFLILKYQNSHEISG